MSESEVDRPQSEETSLGQWGDINPSDGGQSNPLEPYEDLTYAGKLEESVVLGRLHRMATLYRRLSGNRYAHFSGASAEEYYQLSHELVTYAHDEGVGALVLVDKAARPAYVGFTEVWRARYPNKPRPHINFMNPFGLESLLEVSDTMLVRAVYEAGSADINFPDRLRSEQDIAQGFATTFKALAKRKEDPVLVVDTCLHSGETAQLITERLRRSQFVDVRLAVVDGAEISPEAVVRPDFILRRRAKGGCYAFGNRDALVVETVDSVTSKPNETLASQQASRELRAEARKIIIERLRRDGVLPAAPRAGKTSGDTGWQSRLKRRSPSSR